ncbi:MAG: Gfo/Idh/MocA family oxidoreductase, partial [Chloroflexi bacterium]|nr:Gfo/Idh/MocA family oxidoreductase [Chloroflexota bacterium]
QVVAAGSRRAEQVHERLVETGLEGQVSVYTSLEDILALDEVDVVSICLPADIQAEAAIKVAKAGKHALIEKPVPKTLDEMRRVRDAFRTAGVKSQVSFVLRWNPFVEIARGLINDGWLGKVTYSRMGYLHELGPAYASYKWLRTKKSGGSTVLLGGCHAIDTLRYMISREAVEVSAFATTVSRTDFEYDSTCASTIRFDDDSLAHLATSFELYMPYTFPIEIMGSRGAMRDGKLWSHKLEGQTDWVTIPTHMPDSADVANHPFQAEIDDLVDAILNDGETRAPIEDTVKTHQIVFAIEQSAAAGGKPVKLPLLD